MELVKGILIAFGVIIGFLIFVALIVKKANKEDEYEPEELIKPFQDYLQKIEEEEVYEQINIVKNIIYELKAGKIIRDVENFKIKKDTSIHLNDEDGRTAIKVHNKYIVVKIIEPDAS